MNTSNLSRAAGMRYNIWTGYSWS